MKEIIRHEITQKTINILLFAVMFVIIGLTIPAIYYKYFDNTEYYKIFNPVKIENIDYFACDFTNVYINRTSLVNSHGNAIISLTLVREDTTGAVIDRIESTYKEIPITKGTSTIVTHWEIPCDAVPGKYYYDGIVEYDVKGIKKYTPFVTEMFDVKG